MQRQERQSETSSGARVSSPPASCIKKRKPPTQNVLTPILSPKQNGPHERDNRQELQRQKQGQVRMRGRDRRRHDDDQHHRSRLHTHPHSPQQIHRPHPVAPHEHAHIEFTRLQTLMEKALEMQQIQAIEDILAQMISVVETDDSTVSGANNSHRFQAQRIEYLEHCEHALKILIDQDEKERQRARFLGNALMTQVAERLHANTSERGDIDGLLRQAEDAYRKAGDKRSQCIPGIRHRITVDELLTTADQQFNEDDYDAAITTAHRAGEHYSAFRNAPTYHRSQILLSLSESTKDPWNQPPLKDIGVHESELEHRLAHINDYFHNRARELRKNLLERSKSHGETKDFETALAMLVRCEALYQWLNEPCPASMLKWKRQVSRQRVAQQLTTLTSAPNHAKLQSQLVQWTTECSSLALHVDDIIDAGAVTYMLQVINANTFEAQDRPSLALAVHGFLLSCLSQKPAIDRIFSSTQLATSALLFLSAHLPQSDTISVLHILGTVIESKQAVHVAIHKCSFLESLCELRKQHISNPEIITDILSLWHHVLSTSFPVFFAIMNERGVFRAVIATFTRYYKSSSIASFCLQIIRLACRIDNCGNSPITALNTVETGLCATLVRALLHYCQVSNAPRGPQLEDTIAIIYMFCEQDHGAAVAFEAAKITQAVDTIARISPPVPIPADIMSFFESKRFQRHVRENIHRQPFTREGTTRHIRESVKQLPQEVNMTSLPSHTNQGINEALTWACIARFGVKLMLKKQRQFCIVHVFASPNRAIPCRIRVTAIKAICEVNEYSFSNSNATGGASVVHRELRQPNAAARVAFFRSVFPSLTLEKKIGSKAHSKLAAN